MQSCGSVLGSLCRFDKVSIIGLHSNSVPSGTPSLSAKDCSFITKIKKTIRKISSRTLKLVETFFATDGLVDFDNVEPHGFG